MNDLDVLDDPALAGLFDELRALGAGTPPPIGDELSALFSGIAPLARRRHPAVVIAFLSATVLGGTVGSAAAEILPDPAQRFVAGVIRTFTPFDLPTPVDEEALIPPSPAPARLTPPANEPERSHSTAPSDRPEGTGDERADDAQTDDEQADDEQTDDEQSADEQTNDEQGTEERSDLDGPDARPDDTDATTERESDEGGPAPVDDDESQAPSAPALDEPSADGGTSDRSGDLTELDASDSSSSDSTD